MNNLLKQHGTGPMQLHRIKGGPDRVDLQSKAKSVDFATNLGVSFYYNMTHSKLLNATFNKASMIVRIVCVCTQKHSHSNTYTAHNTNRNSICVIRVQFENYCEIADNHVTTDSAKMLGYYSFRPCIHRKNIRKLCSQQEAQVSAHYAPLRYVINAKFFCDAQGVRIKLFS